MTAVRALRGALLLAALVAMGSCDSSAPGGADKAANSRTDVRHRLETPPDSFAEWARSTAPSAVAAANELAKNSEATGDRAKGAFYLPRGGAPGIPYLIYVGTQLGHDDYSILGAGDFLDTSFESIGFAGSDYTKFPTRSDLGGTLACASTSHENVPQVVCIWGAPEVMGTALFNLDRQRPMAWAAAQTRELRELVEHAEG